MKLNLHRLHRLRNLKASLAWKYVAPAPVIEKYVSPVVQKYIAPAPIVKTFAAPIVASAQPVVKYTSAEHSAHVSVNGPHFNYHY